MAVYGVPGAGQQPWPHHFLGMGQLAQKIRLPTAADGHQGAACGGGRATPALPGLPRQPD